MSDIIKDFDIKTAKVKDCPLRLKRKEGVRHYGSVTFFACQYPEGHMGRPHLDSEHGVTCELKWNTKLSECEEYNIWSVKQVREAFKKLEEIENHRDAVIGVLRM
jgi:hypothetical protein